MFLIVVKVLIWIILNLGLYTRAVSGECLADPIGGPLRSLLRMPDRILLLAVEIRLRPERGRRAETVVDASVFREESETAAGRLDRPEVGHVRQGQ